jgi:diguanylate cyclase (GGDEF)-like protein
VATSPTSTVASKPGLIALGREVGRAQTVEDARALLVSSIEAALATPCLIRSQDGTNWHTIARSRGAAMGFDAERAIPIPLTQVPAFTELLIARPTDPSAARRLADAEWREVLGGVLASALQLVELKAQRAEAVRREEAVDRFSRALLGIVDGATLHRAIVEHMARSVGAEIGALAVYLPHENSLAITATVGYPAVLVEHVRLAPGEGVIGRVFSTGQAIVASNLGAVPGHLARRRYRTNSYVALPLAGADGVAAVVSLTDKAGSAPFTDADLALLERMAVPAALAVGRELLRDRTIDLAHLATVDALTGLFNRRYFETRVEQELQRQRRQGEELSLLMLDLDNFKDLNDTHGHLVGDIALKEVAEILRRAVRIFDVCARYGGEEFVILMPGAGSSTALRIAERIRRQVEQHFASGLRSGVPVPLTVSIGVSTATPSVSRDALVAQADSALLEAKVTGKNQVRLAEGL